MDYKLVERMYQEAVESSLSSSSTNQVDDQVKYLTSRLLQEMGLIGGNRSCSSSTSTSTTTTHGDEIQPQEQQEKQQQQQAAILALYELNFGLSHYDDSLISTSPINRTTTTTPSIITSTGDDDDDVSSTTLVPLQGTREKKKIPATVVAPIAGVAVDDTNAISCSLLSWYSTTSTLTLSSSTWNDDDSMWRPWNVSNHSTR